MNNIKNIRKNTVAGSFYPDNKDEINKYFDYFNQILEKNNIFIDTSLTPKAIISPHAGYIYSGFSANLAYRYLQNKEFKRIVIIGPSHKVRFDGASISLYNTYQTPLSNLDIDIEYANDLIDQFEFLNFYDEVHQEHSTETQAPFLKYYVPNTKIIEIVYGNILASDLSNLIDKLLQDDSLIVISTDLSHFYTLDVANAKDSICVDAIRKIDIDILDSGCEACGIIGVKAMLISAKKQNLKSKILDYRTSADASGDKNRVVGYLSALFIEILQ